MDIDENQQEQEIGIAQAQIEPVSDESKNQSISPRPSRISRSNRDSNSLAPPPTTSVATTYWIRPMASRTAQPA